MTEMGAAIYLGCRNELHRNTQPTESNLCPMFQLLLAFHNSQDESEIEKKLWCLSWAVGFEIKHTLKNFLHRTESYLMFKCL